jgi:hypothetical protein
MTKKLNMKRAKEEGIKNDADKPKLSLIPRKAQEAEARVWAFGAQKYGRGNYRKGFAWSRALDALLRHATAISGGEFRDPETGEHHAAHIRCCAAMLIYFFEHNIGEDDLSGDVK